MCLAVEESSQYGNSRPNVRNPRMIKNTRGKYMEWEGYASGEGSTKIFLWPAMRVLETISSRLTSPRSFTYFLSCLVLFEVSGKRSSAYFNNFSPISFVLFIAIPW